MPITINGAKLFSIEETARVCNVAEQTVRNWIKQERLEGIKIGRATYILDLSLLAFLKLPDTLTYSQHIRLPDILREYYYKDDKSGVVVYTAKKLELTN